MNLPIKAESMRLRRCPFSRAGRINTGAIGLVLLVITLLVSLGQVVKNVNNLDRPTKKRISICHWQLEAGYRDSLDVMIADYEKLHPDVEVVQMPVTEKLYAEWINTQLISGKGPDICEMGQSSLLYNDESTVRFFSPLGDDITKPNPYNVGTPLEGVPWKETFIDGMRGGYKPTLGDYYVVPTNMTGMRLYVNSNLLQKVTGSDQLPHTFKELIDDCEAIRQYSNQYANGRIIPLVTCYGMQGGGVTGPYLVPFTASLEPELDVDLDGLISDVETYRGFVTKQISFQTPQVSGYFHAMKDLTDQMQRGFASMDRQTAQFRFVNGNAAFLHTGSWDAAGTFEAAKQNGIQVELVDFPLPKPGDKYGNLIAGRANEAAGGVGSPFGVYKLSPHRALAIDFLQFLTSLQGNEKLSQISSWPPDIIGAKPLESMKPFMPNPIGFTSSLRFGVGTQVATAYNTDVLQYYQGDNDQPSFDNFVKNYLAALFNPNSGGDWACGQDFDKLWRSCRTQERLLERDELLAMTGSAEYSAQRYRRNLLQQVRHNNGRSLEYEFEQFRGKPLPEP